MQLEARRYVPSHHQWLIRSWLIHYEMDPSLSDDLPEVGIIVMDEKDALAAGFLRRMEGRVALFDGLIANPKAFGTKRRSHAIDLVLQAIEGEARRLQLRSIYAFSRDNGTLRRSQRLGYIPLPDRMIVRDLS